MPAASHAFKSPLLMANICRCHNGHAMISISNRLLNGEDKQEEEEEDVTKKKLKQ